MTIVHSRVTTCRDGVALTTALRGYPTMTPELELARRCRVEVAA